MKYCPNPECPGQPKPGVRPEFVDSAYVCSDCGTPLVYASEFPEQRPSGHRDEHETDVEAAGDELESTEGVDDWVPVDIRLRGAAALIARGRLGDAGIEAVVPDESATSDFPSLTSATEGAPVFVHERDLSRAREVLAAARAAGDTDASEPWVDPPAAETTDRVIETGLPVELCTDVSEILEAEGIAVEFVEESPNSPAAMLGPGMGRYRAIVNEADAPRAMRLLADWHAEIAADASEESPESAGPDS